MVTPLGQRMVFQTAHTEAARVAHDVAHQLQREEAFKKSLADRMAEDKYSVKGIAESQAMRTEERQERQKRFANQSNDEGNKEEDDDSKQDDKAVSADKRLDFLA
ncbi:MAG: hypothetical protein LBH03_03695 [Holophagales bacterium]|jgi:hypothetical protein|nr:hypothetical protein [Holophagales bacterium]